MGVHPLFPSSRAIPINGPEENLWRKIIYYDIVKNEKLLHPLRGCARKTEAINESCSPLDFYSFFALRKDFCTLVLSRVVFHLSTFLGGGGEHEKIEAAISNSNKKSKLLCINFQLLTSSLSVDGTVERNHKQKRYQIVVTHFDFLLGTVNQIPRVQKPPQKATLFINIFSRISFLLLFRLQIEIANENYKRFNENFSKLQ